MKTLIIIVSLICVFLVSCDWFKDSGTENQKVNNNEILIDDIETVDIQCIRWIDLDKTVIIQNDSEYQDLKNYKYKYTNDDSCKEVILPNIDFTKRTLLGMQANCGGCCPPGISYKFIKNEDKKNYSFIVSRIQYGTCKRGWERMHWITVPKTDPEYSINFNLEITVSDSCDD